jgi:4-hydroxy-tetrahydrodipicolinate synthase
MLKGSIAALITPFDEFGGIDFIAFERLLRLHVDAGTDGLVLCGCTGEGAALSFEEKCAIFERASKCVGRQIPLIAATGTNVTAESVQLSREAKRLGLDGCMAIVPYYNRPTPKGCLAHFQEIAKVGLPVMIYHHPGRTGVKLEKEALQALFALPGVFSIKDATGDLSLATDLVDQIPHFTGDDGLSLPQFSIGFTGSVSVVANVIPREWKAYIDLCLQGKFVEAREIFFSLKPLVDAMCLETNPQCVKYAVSLQGHCEANYRLPLMPPSEEHKEILRSQIAELALR